METRAETGDTYMHNSWAHKQQQPNTHRHTGAHKHMHKHTHTNTCTITFTNTCTNTRTNIRTNRRARTHTRRVLRGCGCGWLCVAVAVGSSLLSFPGVRRCRGKNLARIQHVSTI